MTSNYERSLRSRKIAFVLAGTNHGMMILNRLDYHRAKESGFTYGVGHSLLEEGHFDPQDVSCLKDILTVQRELRGDGVMALDIGANLGVHTIEWAKHMTGWGDVLAIEAQERIFYALTGNIALNNCFNARAINIAMSDSTGSMQIPVPDYCSPGSFGSLELQFRTQGEYIGQTISYDQQAMTRITTQTIDSLSLARVDLLKIDVEGMEMAVLRGAVNTIRQQRPVMFVEHIKLDKEAFGHFLETFDYTVIRVGMNSIAFHRDDRIRSYF